MQCYLKQTVPPAAEPLTTAEAKLHLRVDSGTEDLLIGALIETSRRMAEAYTSRQFITATYTLKINDFPGSYGTIPLPRTPLGSVSSIAYVDVNGDTQTLSTDYYESISDDVSACVVLKPGKSWPQVQSDKYHAVTVTFTAGYGSAGSDVPESARSAMLLLIGHLYENRESVITGTISTQLPLGATALLDTVSAREAV